MCSKIRIRTWCLLSFGLREQKQIFVNENRSIVFKIVSNWELYTFASLSLSAWGNKNKSIGAWQDDSVRCFECSKMQLFQCIVNALPCYHSAFTLLRYFSGMVAFIFLVLDIFKYSHSWLLFASPVTISRAIFNRRSLTDCNEI